MPFKAARPVAANMRKLLCATALCLVAACAVSPATQLEIDAIRAEQASISTQLEGSLARLSEIAAGAPSNEGEAEALQDRVSLLEGELRGREQLIERKKAEDLGSQSGLLQELLIGVAGLFGLGGFAQARFGKSRSNDAVIKLQAEVGHLAGLIGAFQAGMNKPQDPA